MATKVMTCFHQAKYTKVRFSQVFREITVLPNPYQEEVYGKNMSLHNSTNKEGRYRCTVCGKENTE